MESPEHAVEQHYGSADSCARILASLRVAGRDLERLERRDRTPFDEFHGGGIASTRDLAAFAGMRADMHVLDLGCDISGPARTLAAEFGCRVSGLDLTAEFVRAADMLTSRIGMQDVCDLEPQGWLTRDAQNSYLAGDGLEAGPMDELLGSSITYRIAVGPQQGRKVFTLRHQRRGHGGGWPVGRCHGEPCTGEPAAGVDSGAGIPV